MKNREDLTFTANIKILIDTIKRQLAVGGVVLNLNCFVSLSIQNLRQNNKKVPQLSLAKFLALEIERK